MRKKKIWALVLVALTIAAMPLGLCLASSSASLSQAYVQEQYLDAFIAGGMNQDNLSVKVGNQTATVLDAGSLAEKGITVRTTVLIDISKSVPTSVRADVKAYVDALIAGIAQNEQYKIVTFDEQLTVLQDFTSDRYDLANATSKIEFKGMQSKIYDAIYNTIPSIQPLAGKPCYYRTIVITDGIDDTVSGVTKEELYLRLQTETYPIDVVAVSKTKQAEPEKELSALTRMSGGRYANVYPSADISGVASSLSVYGIIWIRAEVPAALLDGSTRQVNISDESNSVQFDLKVSVYDAPVTPTPESPKPSPVRSPSVSKTPTEPPASTGKEDSGGLKHLFGDYTMVVFIVAGVVLIILIAIIVAVVITHGWDRNGDSDHKQSDPSTKTPINEAYFEKTEYIDDTVVSDAQYTIKLSSSNNPSKSWTLPVNGELLIGRAEYAAIRLDDKSVSREQCKIVVSGNGLAIVHLSQTNKTSLNRSNVVSSKSLQSGDTIKFGRESLYVDYIQSVGTPPSPPDEPYYGPKTERIHTEAIF